MDVSPQTLREVEFRGALRGYNPDDVDEFLDRVAAGIEILQERLRQATERAVRAEARASDPDEGAGDLRNTLVLAQRTADLAVQEAKETAAQLVAEAEARAAGIVAQAERSAALAAEDAQRQLRRELSELGEARDALRADVAALAAHLESERVRVREALADVLRRLDTHVTRASDAPPDTPVTIPPPPVVAEATVGLDADADADTDAELEDLEGEAGATAGPTGLGTSRDLDTDDSDDSDDADRAAPAVEHDDDPFFAELRRAVDDDQPLGPRDDDADPFGEHGDGFFDQDGEHRRFGSRLRRRR